MAAGIFGYRMLGGEGFSPDMSRVAVGIGGLRM